MPIKPNPLTREQVEEIRAAGNYTKAAQEMGIGSNRAARIKQASTLEEALHIAGIIVEPDAAPQAPAASPSNGDHPPASDNGTRGKPPPAKTPAARKAEDTQSLTEASVVAFVPREIKVNSVLLLVAKKATEQEWGWPEMEVGRWLDNYLYHSLRQRGIIIGSYIRVGKEHGV